MKNEGNCSLDNYFTSVSPRNNKNPITKNLTNTERLEKTSVIWNQPDYTRNVVDEILEDFEVGIFIVRENSEKIMVLSYRADNDIQHVRIKNNSRNEIYMEGSHISFENINEMICHYMTHSIQSSHVFLKLPRALEEAYDTNHFKFFVKMKADFWKTSLPNKSINEIFINSLKRVSKEPYSISIYNEISDNESTSPLSLKQYNINDLNCNNGLAYVIDQDKHLKKSSIWKCPIWKCFTVKCGTISHPISNINKRL